MLVRYTEVELIKIPYTVQVIEQISKFMIMMIERSPTDFVRYDFIICGKREITEVIDAMNPEISINNSTFMKKI